MPSFIGNSTIKTGYIPGGPGSRGPQGPQGPQGTTGNTGPTGNTGSSGFSILSLGKTGADKVVITLNDSNLTEIIIDGLTGSAGVAPTVYGAGSDQYYEFRGTIPSSDSIQSFLLVESVNGVTTTFKVIEATGITFSYTADKLVIDGPNVTAIRNLQETKIIGASGSNAFSFTGFTYTSGLTYDIFAISGVTGILHSLTENINTSSLGLTLQNTNFSVSQFYYNSADKKWYSKETFKFNNGSSTTQITDQSIIFEDLDAIPYPKIEMGSCCFCNTDDIGINSTVCYDYMTPEQCSSLSGSFSSTLSCLKRGGDSACKNAIPENGACCTCGTNFDTGLGNQGSCTQNLTKNECLQLGFKYFKLPSGADCSSALVNCDQLDCGPGKKKIIKLANRTYPSNNTCAITEDGNVICWGDGIGSKTITVRPEKIIIDSCNPDNINDWFADEIAVGENHVVILAKPIDYTNCDQYQYNTPPLDPNTKTPILRKNKTKLLTKSFVKSTFEDVISTGNNIWFSTLGVSNPYEVALPNSTFKFGNPTDVARYDTFIGIRRSDRTLFGSGYGANYPNQFRSPLFPLPDGQFLDVSNTGLHAAGLRFDGKVVVWGNNSFGQLNTPNTNKKFVRVVTGRYHTCALTEDNKVLCWGAGISGAGNGNWPHYGQSIVPDTLKNKDVIQLECGYYFTAALTDSGEVYTWGSFRGVTQPSTTDAYTRSDFNSTIYAGIRKDLNRELVNKPIELETFGARLIACSPYSIAALGKNNKLYGWGHDGELGLTGDTGIPLPKKGIPSAIQRFNKQIVEQGVDLYNVEIPSFAVDRDENVYVLLNFYGCAGVTFLSNIFQEAKVPASGGNAGTQKPTSTGLTGIALFHYSTNLDVSNYKNFFDRNPDHDLWSSGVNSGCFNCRVMNETEFEEAKSIGFKNGIGAIPYTEFGSNPNTAMFITQGITGMQSPSEKPTCFSGGTFIADQIYEYCKDPSRNGDTRPWCISPRTWHAREDGGTNCDPDNPGPFGDDCALWLYGSIGSPNDPGYPFEVGLTYEFGVPVYYDLILLDDGTYGFDDGTGIPALDSDGNKIKKPVMPCSNLYGCRKGPQHYRSIIWKANRFNCINCIVGDECDAFDLSLANRIGGLTAQSFVGSNRCFYKETQQYVWQTDDNKTQLHPIFQDKLPCVDLDYDRNPNNDEDDLLGCSKQILKQQIILKFNADTFIRAGTDAKYPAVQSCIEENNVLCANKNSTESFWTDEKFAYTSPYNICNRTKQDIIENWYEPYYVKQRITDILTSGNMAYYVMTPDLYFMNDFGKLVNYRILTLTNGNNSNITINKLYAGESGELLIINRNSEVFKEWNNGSLVSIAKNIYGESVAPLSCDPYTLQINRDPAFSSDTGCGYAPFVSYYGRILAGSIGHKHGVYVVASPDCEHDLGITFDINPVCLDGYVAPMINGTGYTGLNGNIIGPYGTTYQSDFWRAVEENREGAGNPFLKIKYTTEPLNIDSIPRVVARYAASAGYYHSCIITDETITVNNITYNPGDVICWGVGAQNNIRTKFSFDQAPGITYSEPNKALQISCGNFHTLVLEEIDGEKQLRAYGAGKLQQTDIRATTYDFGQSLIPDSIKAIQGMIKYIGCGPSHNGVIYQTGNNEYIYSGWGYGNSNDAWIGSVKFSKKVIDFSMGDEHVVILFDDGTTECLCNSNDDGKCNISREEVYKNKKYKHIYAKSNLTLAVDKNDIPFIFGNIKDNLEAIPPDLINIENGRIIKKIAAGKDHTLVLKGYVDDALGVGDVIGYGNDTTLSEIPDPPIKWLKTGSASNTTVAAIDTHYNQLKIYGDGRNEPYINESAYKFGLIGTTGISTKPIQWILANQGTLSGITITNYLQYLRREKLKDPVNTGYSCKDITAEGLRGVAIKTIPDVKWNRNDLGFNSKIIPWGYQYKTQPRSLNRLFEQAKLVVDENQASPTKGEIFAVRLVPSRIETNVLGTVVKLEKFIIKVGDDSSPLEKIDELWVAYGDNSNNTLGTPITGIREFSGLFNISARISLLNRTTGTQETKIITKFKEISCGRWHTVGIIDDPIIVDGIPSPLDYHPFIWGDTDIRDNYGQFELPVADDGMPLRFRAISAGNYHNVGILYKGHWDQGRTIGGIEYSDYEVYCWGAELGGSETDFIINYGQTVTPLDKQGRRIKASQVSAGLYHSLAISLTGEPYGWGAGSDQYADNNSRLANPHYGQAVMPVNSVGNKLKFKYISAGDYHSGGILNDGTLILWGDNRSNQCNEIYSKTEKFTKIDCANQYTIGLTELGAVYGWGFGSAESQQTLPLVSPSQQNPGYSILSAFPPRETLGLSNFYIDNARKKDKDIPNFVGENNIAITKDAEEVYFPEFNSYKTMDVLDAWGDNTFYPMDFFEEIYIPTFRTIYQNYNYPINEELSVFLTYNSGYINRPNFKLPGGKIYQFIDGHGLNAGFDYRDYIENNSDIEYLNSYPLSKIDGVTGVPLPIFADYGSSNKNNISNRGIAFVHGPSDDSFDYDTYRPASTQTDENGVSITTRPPPDKWSINPLGFYLSTQADGYYGVGPSQFFMIQESDVIDGATAFVFYCNTPRDHYKWQTIPKSNVLDGSQDANKLSVSNKSYEANQPFPTIGADRGPYTFGYKSTFGINWGLMKDDEGLYIKEYDWLDAYSFALGWNPNTNQRVDYFDLHHNIWVTDPKLKEALPECDDCVFINDIKNGFTPLEVINGRFGYNVYNLNMDASNHHASGRGMIKVCGKLDLGDPRIKPWVKAINSLYECGDPCGITLGQADDTKEGRNTCKEYLIDTTALFGSMFYANTDPSYPLEYSDHDYAGEEEPPDRLPTRYVYHDFTRESTDLQGNPVELKIDIEVEPYGTDLRDVVYEQRNPLKIRVDKEYQRAQINPLNKEGFLHKQHFTKWLKLKYFWKTENRCDSDAGCGSGDVNVKDDKKYIFRYRPKVAGSSGDSLWVCFHVYGNYNWGDNSRGQLGDIEKTDNRDLRKETYKEKSWTPAFLNANVNPENNLRTQPISCGMYHTLYDFSEINEEGFKTFYNPYMSIQAKYAHSRNFEPRPTDDPGVFQTDNFDVFVETIKYAPLKPVQTGYYIHALPCAFRVTGKTYLTAGQNTEFEATEKIGGEGAKIQLDNNLILYPQNRIHAAGNKHNYISLSQINSTYTPFTWGGLTFEGRGMTGIADIQFPPFWTQDCANRLGLTAGLNLQIFPECCKEVFGGVSFSDGTPEGRYLGGNLPYDLDPAQEYWRRDQRRNGCLQSNCPDLNTCKPDPTSTCRYCPRHLNECYTQDAIDNQQFTEENRIGDWLFCWQREPECTQQPSETDSRINCRACKLDNHVVYNIKDVSSRADHNIIVMNYDPTPAGDHHIYTEAHIYNNATRVQALSWEKNRGFTLFNGPVAQGLFGEIYGGVNTYMAKFQNFVILGSHNQYGQVTLPPVYKTNKEFDYIYESDSFIGISGGICSVFGPGFGLGDASQRTDSLMINQFIAASAGKYHNAYAGYFGCRKFGSYSDALSGVLLPLHFGTEPNTLGDNSPANLTHQDVKTGTLKGFTYSLYDQNIVVWGATYSNQDILPEPLLPGTTAKSIFDIDFGDKEIKNIDWSFDEKYILVSLNRGITGEVVVIDANDALIDKKYTELDRILTDNIVKARWMFPSSKRFIVATQNTVKSYFVSKDSSRTINFDLEIKRSELTLEQEQTTYGSIKLLNNADINGIRYFCKTIQNAIKNNNTANLCLYFYYNNVRYKYIIKLDSKLSIFRMIEDVTTATLFDHFDIRGKIFLVDENNVHIREIDAEMRNLINFRKISISKDWSVDDVTIEADSQYELVSYDRQFLETITDINVSKNSKAEVFVGFNNGNIYEIDPIDSTKDLLFNESLYPNVTGYNLPKTAVTVLETDNYSSVYSGYSNGIIKSWDYNNKLKWVSFAKSSYRLNQDGYYPKEPLGAITSLSAGAFKDIFYRFLTPGLQYSIPLFWSSTKNIENNHLLNKNIKLFVSPTLSSTDNTLQYKFVTSLEITDPIHLRWIEDVWFKGYSDAYDNCESINFAPEFCWYYDPRRWDAPPTSDSYLAYTSPWSVFFKYNTEGQTKLGHFFGYTDNFVKAVNEYRKQYKQNGRLNKFTITFDAVNFVAENLNIYGNKIPYRYTKNGEPRYYYQLDNIDTYKQLQTDGLLGVTFNSTSGYFFNDLGLFNLKTNVPSHYVRGSTAYYPIGADVEDVYLQNYSYGNKNTSVTRIGIVDQGTFVLSDFPESWFNTTSGTVDRHSSVGYEDPYFNLLGKNYNHKDINGLAINNPQLRDKSKDDNEDIIKIQSVFKYPLDTKDGFRTPTCFYLTLGTDNDLRITSYSNSNLDDNPDWNFIYSGIKNADGTPDRTKAPTDATWSPDGSHIALGRKDGKLKIIDPFNRFVLVRPLNGERKTNIVKLQCGDDHTCLLYQDLIEKDNKIVCWGDNQHGQIDWPAEQQERYRLLFPNTDISQIWCGGQHNCIITNENVTTQNIKIQKTPLCWGNSGFQTKLPNSNVVDMGLGREYTAWIDPQIRSASGAAACDSWSGGINIQGNLTDFYSARRTNSYIGGVTTGIILGNAFKNIVAGTTHVIGIKYWNDECAGTTVDWTFTYDTFGDKYSCVDTIAWDNGLTPRQRSKFESIPYGTAIIRKEIIGTDSVYVYGDNTHKQSEPAYLVNSDGKLLNGYYLANINNTFINRYWSYYSTASIDGLPNIDSFMGLDTNYDVHVFRTNNYAKGMNAGGYYNVASWRDAFINLWYIPPSGTERQDINTIKDVLYGWGDNRFNQIDFKKTFANYQKVDLAKESQVITAGKNHLAMFVEPNITGQSQLNIYSNRIIGMGCTLEKQIDFVPTYTDIAIGNGYSVYVSDLGLVLPKVSYNPIWAQYYESLFNLYYAGTLGGCSNNPFASWIRSFRSIREIAVGEDQGMLITNEGKALPIICLPGGGAPRYFKDITGSQLSMNSIPANWYGYSINTLQFGYYHISALAKGKVYTYSVSPSYKFSGQFNQGTIPIPLTKASNVKYLSSGKYNTSALTEIFSESGEIVRKLWQYGKI